MNTFERSPAEREQRRGLRDALIDGLGALEGVSVRGSSNRLDNNVHITMEGASGEVALYLLDAEGIYVSTGSACQAGVAESSHVVSAMGLGEQAARSALRFTLGYATTHAEITRVLEVFPSVLERARAAGYPS
jgi:cysteine desulfurase